MSKVVPMEAIVSKIYMIRGLKVMLDRDLAELYRVETKQLKRAVRRNIDRFPSDFMFDLTRDEFTNLRSHIGTSSWGGERYVPMAFTQENELVPFPEKVDANFNAWVAQQWKKFTEEQIRWLEMIRDHIAGNLSIETDGFEYAPFSQAGGIGRVYQLFGDNLNVILDDLNERLVA